MIVACFDDTGLDAARCLTAAPVVGIGEAGFHFASMLSNKAGARGFVDGQIREVNAAPLCSAAALCA